MNYAQLFIYRIASLALLVAAPFFTNGGGLIVGGCCFLSGLAVGIFASVSESKGL